MLVWGGAGTSGRVRSGGRYDPSTDSWSPITISASPIPRSHHSAVWTGSRMVVWGGLDYFVEPARDGGVYDPSLNRWSSLSTDGAPDPRFYHHAVWTGSAMLIWGRTPNGGMYSLGHDQDDDGDGFSECAGDCDDAAGATHPQALEFCDWRDNDCDGLVDNDAGPPGAATTLRFDRDPATIVWPRLPGADAYHVVKGNLIQMRRRGTLQGTDLGCEEQPDAPGGRFTDPELPSPRTGFYYLFRGIGCGAQAGTFDGEGSSQIGGRDAGLTGACP
jgi:hypothetical protein